MSDSSAPWGAAQAAADRLDAGESWKPQTPPEPAELARELEQKRGVGSATPQYDCDTPRVEIVLAPRFDTVPRWVARPVYRVGLAIEDVTPIANGSYLQVTVVPPEGRR